MNRKSTWRQYTKPVQFSPLHGRLEADVAIVGGGLTGIIAAYLLKDSGLSVAVIEEQELGYRGSGSTTAFLMEVLDTSPHDLIEAHGKDTAKHILDSHRDAISWYERTSKAENIECEFTRTPFYSYARTQRDAHKLEREAEALKVLGRDVQFHTDDALTLKNYGYYTLPQQAKFHPLKFLFALSKKLSNNVHIFEHTSISVRDIQAQWILMATHYPLGPQPPSLYFKKAAYLTYVVEAHVEKGTLPEALFDDTDNPYHYLRVDRLESYDRILLGGEDHRMDIKVDEEKSFESLKQYLKEILPGIPFHIEREWKGMLVEPGDGLAYIGPLQQKNLFYATGYSGNGITYAAIAAHLFRDFVLGTGNPWQELYATNRPFHLRAHFQGARRYLGEFLGGAIKNLFS